MFRTPLLAAALLSVLMLAGCSDSGIAYYSGSYLQLSPMAPPAPIKETAQIPANPKTEYWRDGYWVYDDGSFDWMPGELIARPDASATWSPDHWMEHTYGWAFVPGYWQ